MFPLLVQVEVKDFELKINENNILKISYSIYQNYNH